MSVNKVIVMGRLGQDPELKYTPAGTAVCNFSVATSKSWVDKSGTKQEKTEWHRLVSWGKQGEVINQYFSKGSEIYVEGELTTDQYTKEGESAPRYITKINVREFSFTGGSKAAGAQQGSQQGSQQGGQQGPGYDPSQESGFSADDIPF